jgi:3-isopropylmalate/(R)-2-methylmalate dehydratase large subunit
MKHSHVTVGLTAVEKILSRHADREVRAGDVTVAAVDRVMVQDGNAPLAIRLLREELGAARPFDPERVVLVIDHCAPSPNEGAANMHRVMREFARDTGVTLFDAGAGISHVIFPENGLALPGELVVGSDSHSVTYGAINCLGTGMGATDIAVAMMTGKALLRVPETIAVELSGALPADAAAKDLALEFVHTVGVDGATYCSVEVGGRGLRSLDMDGRMTLCSIGIEVGAKCVLMPVDDLCRDYARGRSPRAWHEVWSDEDASFTQELVLDLDRLEPMVALPHDLTQIVPLREVHDQRIDMAFIGSCTNSRLSDLQAAADVLRGRRVDRNVRLVVTPGSREVFLAALDTGIIDVLVRAGGMVTTPGCGACVGAHQGIPADGEVVMSSMNRNFKGRMGNRNAAILLASPASVAASAVVGRVASARELA